MTSKPKSTIGDAEAGSNGSEPEEIRSSRQFTMNSSIGDVGENERRPHGDAVHLDSFLQKQSKRMARNPCTYMLSSILVALVLSVVRIIIGEFEIVVEDEGWWSRGTQHSNRQRQSTFFRNQRFNLAFNESAWDIVTDPDIDHPSYETNLYSAPVVPKGMTATPIAPEDKIDCLEADTETGNMRKLIEEAREKNEERRRLDLDAPEIVLSGCDLEFYSYPPSSSLWPIWEIPDKEYESTNTRTVLDADVLEAICLAEANTQAHLEENGHCDTSRGCNSGKCMPPYSIVLYARLVAEGALDSTSNGEYVMDCKSLAQAWTPDLQEFVQKSWIQDINDLKILLTPGASSGEGEKEEPQYLYGYYPALVQSDFDTNGGRSQYTSSIFDTGSADLNELYDEVDSFDRAESSGIVLGAYDNSWESFNEKYVDGLLIADMSLALASAFVIMVAIMLHTQSPLITCLGVLQIILSFPVSFFFYSIVLGLPYFPFLNFIGVFVVFALGAGDIFVAFDKWTNYRKNNKNKSTEYVAAQALPEALSAMFLTTLTTALAFFATAVCPVTPIKMFAIFSGLLILFDYILTVGFVFPALCIMDRALIKRSSEEHTGGFFSCWMACVGCGTCFSCCSHSNFYDDVVVGESGSDRSKESKHQVVANAEENYSKLQKILLKLSYILHRSRWPLLAVSLGSFGFFCYYASKLSLPDSSDVRLLKPNMQFEQAYAWRKEILASDLDSLAGSSNSIIWGLGSDDTGKQSDPYDGTSIVLDETFDPSSIDAQISLRNFCGNFYKEDFARVPTDNYICPINEFDQWLKDQSSSDEPDPLHDGVCGGAARLPVDSDKFHGCITAWAMKAENFNVISRDGVVKYMRVPFKNPAIFTDPYAILEGERESIQGWLTTTNKEAPDGINKAYMTGITFHWHDTNKSIQKTAYSSAGISLAASAVIILFSSHSVVLTIFSTATILYILVSVTSVLVAFGWTLGFLESICFSILIGISADFVIHFTHAYVHHKGDLPREERTRYALTNMGPSILTTAATTFFSAIVMIFCVITFFNKFAQVLFFTIIFATLASFIVFITLANCFGPSNPTYLVDKCLESCFGVDFEERQKGALSIEDDNAKAKKYSYAEKVTSLDA